MNSLLTQRDEKMVHGWLDGEVREGQGGWGLVRLEFSYEAVDEIYRGQRRMAGVSGV